METIKNYLDNVFANLPETDEVLDLKKEILSNMEDKYNELKAEGKTENEAIGIVISEFGNIDELISELGMKREDTENSLPNISKEQVEQYIEIKKKSSRFIALGVFLILTGVSLLIFMMGMFSEDGLFYPGSDNLAAALGLICLFVFLLPAIALFIYTGISTEKFKFIEEGKFTISPSLKAFYSKDYDKIREHNIFGIIVGVCILVISPVPLITISILFEEKTAFILFSVCVLLFMVSIGVVILICSCIKKDSYDRVLQYGEFAPEFREKNKKVEAIGSFYWPIVVAIFLVIGFVFNGWAYGWIVFPIAGVLFGGISNFYSQK